MLGQQGSRGRHVTLASKSLADGRLCVGTGALDSSAGGGVDAVGIGLEKITVGAASGGELALGAARADSVVPADVVVRTGGVGDWWRGAVEVGAEAAVREDGGWVGVVEGEVDGDELGG